MEFPPKRIRRLERRKQQTTRELISRVKKARKRVAQDIRKAAREKKSATNSAYRRSVYAKAETQYRAMLKDLNAELLKATEKTARDMHAQAVSDRSSRIKSPIVEFDSERIDRYWELINSSNESGLAAVFTQRMAERDIRELRTGFIETFRQAQLDGWTANDIQKQLQMRWDSIAGNMADHRFVDASGRKWENARYLQMLTQTTLARVQRESYIDTLTEFGDRLGQIQSYGENCPVCDAWDGVILDLTGSGNDHPSYQEAVNAGMFHPNCDCSLEGIVDTLDQEEIDRQAEVKNVDWEDRKQVQSYNDQIAVKQKVDSGMTQKAAEIDLKRDKVKREVQRSWLGDVSAQDEARSENLIRAVDKIPDSVIERMNEIPRFELVKKGPHEFAHYMPRGRGKIVLDRDDAAWGGHEAAFHHEFGHHIARDFGVIKGGTVKKSFKKAISSDVALIEKNGLFGVPLNELEFESVGTSKLNLALANRYSGSVEDVKARYRAGGVVDILGGLTSGTYGAGHEKDYYQRGANSQNEVFANLWSAHMMGFSEYEKFFPATSKYVKRLP